jgi:hypothetical protein
MGYSNSRLFVVGWNLTVFTNVVRNHLWLQYLFIHKWVLAYLCTTFGHVYLLYRCVEYDMDMYCIQSLVFLQPL